LIKPEGVPRSDRKEGKEGKLRGRRGRKKKNIERRKEM
jgi:hypothetical protein